ncbi:MAG: type II secretion system F family protein [Limisphaerales bacterium]
METPSTASKNASRWALGLLLFFTAIIAPTMVQNPVALLVFLLALLLVCGLFYGVHYVLSLPFRRRERARMFLELLDTSAGHGHGVGQSIIRLSHSRERSFGVRFHLLAAHLEEGLPLLAALEKVPRLLPPAVLAMLRVGAATGDIRRVLPGCRAHLRDALPRVQKAQNYLVALVLTTLPVQVFSYWMFRVVVAPKFEEIFHDMMAPFEYPASSRAIISMLDIAWPAFLALIGLPVLVCLVLYILGPRPAYWLEWLVPKFGPPAARQLDRLAILADHATLLIPWRRRRIERDFAAMLALLLDAGLPEEKAVLMAGESVANRAFLARARRVAGELQRGVKLTDALQFMDDAGELRWRMANAARAAGHFREALAGWLDTLDAKAFSQEQAVAHIVTTACVLVNGCLLGLFAVSIFQVFVQLIDVASAW